MSSFLKKAQKPEPENKPEVLGEVKITILKNNTTRIHIPSNISWEFIRMQLINHAFLIGDALALEKFKRMQNTGIQVIKDIPNKKLRQ